MTIITPDQLYYNRLDKEQKLKIDIKLIKLFE